MDLGTLLNVAQTLFAALQCSELKEMWSMMGYKSELDELSRTVSTVKAVLLDAESKQDDLSHEARFWVNELKAAVYNADDLLDEFVTLAKQKKLIQGGRLSTEVRLFFSRFNQLSVAYNMSQGVKKIRKKLDGIANNHTKFGLSLDYKPVLVDNKVIRNRREETCSYVNSADIIGRDYDVESIVGTLLDSTAGNRDVSFLAIVGMGGLGKTALAQLIYNDAKVATYFPLRLWTCVSDQDLIKFDVKTVLAQILESHTGQKQNDSSLEVLVSRVKAKLAGKKFLIVLDDVWTENRDEWRKLVGYLMGGKHGSWVIITTRSKETSTIVANKHVHELQGLSDENSWRLFQLAAFEQGVDQANSNPHVDLINIGQKIVKYCANVPLAIRVVGSLLYGQDKSKWLSIQEFGLTNLREGENGIKPILKLSYRNLESPLKNCFSYCALFPKDYKIEKELLMSLWIAQGFVVPLEKGQSIEDAGEEYVLILLRRCFFQDVYKDMFGEIYTFKLHDLMHDVALEVTKNEICGVSSLMGDEDISIHHVSARSDALGSNLSITNAHIRTYFHLDSYSDVIPNYTTLLLKNYRWLRALNLFNINTLPDSLGKLIHLRYFEISSSDIEYLPKSITKLYNLQTLDLSSCVKLKELPKDLRKLVNLRVLKLSYANQLTYMPSGMGKLNGLYKLTQFVIGEGNSSPKQRVDLEGLKMLKNLRGTIEIVILFPKSGAFAKCDCVKDGAYMRDKERLNGIRFECKREESTRQTGYEEELLGALQPHANLKELNLVGYHSVTMPRWANNDNLSTFLPNLVRLFIDRCSELQYLPSLRKLNHLKLLHVSELPNLEYIENNPATLLVSNGEELSLLPCLEEIRFFNLPKLKSWWRRSGKGVSDNSISRSSEIHPSSSCSFFRLKHLKISRCPEFTALPNCPNLEDLSLVNFNRELRIMTTTALQEEMGEVTLSTSTPTSYPKLKNAYTDNLAWLYSSLPMEAFQSLISMDLEGDQEVESLTEYKQFFHTCSSSLQILRIGKCPKLRSISGGLQRLARLESLYLHNIPIASLADENIEDEDEGDGMPWGSLSHTLQYLEVYKCKELQSIPRWLCNLTFLRRLQLLNCSEELHARCQSPAGEDWSNIQHIPNLTIRQ